MAILIMIILLHLALVRSESCEKDADCSMISGSSADHVVCKRSQCSCKEEYYEAHTFAADGSKTEVTCSWVVPVWLWILTHILAFLTPIALICCIGYFIRGLGRAFGPPQN